MEPLAILDDGLIQMHFSVHTNSLSRPIEISYFKVHFQVNSIGSYLSSFSLCRFVIEGLLKRAQGTVYSPAPLWSVPCCSLVAALQRAPDAMRRIWITQECSPQKTETVRQQPASVPVLNYHPTRWFYALDLYYSNTHLQDVHTGNRPARTPGRRLLVLQDPCAESFTFLHTSTCRQTQRIMLLS